MQTITFTFNTENGDITVVAQTENAAVTRIESAVCFGDNVTWLTAEYLNQWCYDEIQVARTAWVRG